MQQGLRMCKHDLDMWAEYVRMELLYVQKLRARREVGQGGARNRHVFVWQSLPVTTILPQQQEPDCSCFGAQTFS